MNRVSALSFRQRWNESIEITSDVDKHVADYRFGGLPKPCIHPLMTLAGYQLTGFEMSDHVWHRGIWFAIKFINGTNFWEEHAPFGVQLSSGQPVCQFSDANSLLITHLVDWTSEATGLVIREHRTLRFHKPPEGPDTIDWSTELRAEKDLRLDRTPYTTWGGYGGLSYRAARELHDVHFMLPDGEIVASLAGQKHDWVVMQASVDGGASQRVSFAMIDHPTNPRGQSPWYCKSGNGFNYMNAAFLFHEPMQVPHEQTLCFRYRIVYRDGVWTAEEFRAIADAFRDQRE